MTVLEAAVAAGVPVPHSCRRGDCGHCTAVELSPDAGGAAVDTDVLLCRAAADRGAVYELPEDPFAEEARARTYPAKVVSAERVTPDVVRLRLITPPGRVPEFRGGEHASLTLRDGTSRNYSVAAIDPAARSLDFYIKLVSGGAFSDWLAAGPKAGELLRVRAPLGSFVFRSMPVRATWFVATGTGIVPIYAMLKSLAAASPTEGGTKRIVWGNRRREDIFLEPELGRLCTETGARLDLVFSQAPGEPGERVTDHLRNEHFGGCAIYVAGRPDMVHDVRALALARGADRRSVHADAFAYADIEGPRP